MSAHAQETLMRVFLFAATAALLASSLAQPVVKTDCGPVLGSFDQNLGSSFLGIPYAVPPTPQFGMRFRRSKLLSEGSGCWSGTLNASAFGSHCLQGSDGDEDCLFLNGVLHCRQCSAAARTALELLVCSVVSSAVDGLRAQRVETAPSAFLHPRWVACIWERRLLLQGA